MKNQIEFYNARNEINKERKELKKQLQATENNLANLQTECSHKIVLAFDDYMPHKIGRIIECFCPACGKREDIYPSHEIEKSSFKNSKLIDLTKLSISTFNEYFFNIMEHIFSNYEICYNDDISENEIAKTILSLVETEKKSETQPKVKKLVPNERKDG